MLLYLQMHSFFLFLISFFFASENLSVSVRVLTTNCNWVNRAGNAFAFTAVRLNRHAPWCYHRFVSRSLIADWPVSETRAKFICTIVIHLGVCVMRLVCIVVDVVRVRIRFINSLNTFRIISMDCWPIAKGCVLHYTVNAIDIKWNRFNY